MTIHLAIGLLLSFAIEMCGTSVVLIVITDLRSSQDGWLAATMVCIRSFYSALSFLREAVSIVLRPWYSSSYSALAHIGRTT